MITGKKGELKKKYRIIILLLWIIVIAAILIKYKITASDIAGFIKAYKAEAIVVYLVLSSLRGLFFLPSTPFVFAGILIFPKSKLMVLALSLTGIVISASLIYLLAEYLDIAKLFPAKDRESRINRLREKLVSPKGFFFIVLWAFLPFAPTDLVSYIAGTVRMNYLRFICAIFAGEAIVCGVYVYAGNDIWHLLIQHS